MKTSDVRTLRQTAGGGGVAVAGIIGFLLGSAGCSGLVMDPGTTGSTGPGTTTTSPMGGGTTPTSTATQPLPAGTSTAPYTGPVDVGTVAIHRLNAFEYDNTINDLLGLQQNVAETSFVADEVGANGFNNEADAFTMTDAEFTQYFNSAQNLGETVAANSTLWANIVTCAPASAADTTCLTSIINTFGTKAYRRPLTSAEVSQYQALAADAVTNGADFNGEVKQIVKAMLTSVPFLYRIEADPAGSTAAHPLSAYELATRLSYLLWSSMPDAQLFADAASGALTNDNTLTTEFTRMLASPKASAFTTSFAGQWLGVTALGAHQVEPTAFPLWNENLRQAMMQEIELYFNEFLNNTSLPWSQFLTAPMNFVNGPLAAFYGYSGIPATQTTFTKVMNGDTTGNRIGFMGLGGFLAQTSFSYRTEPTLRGKWVLVEIEGENIPNPPAGIPPLDNAPASDSNVQEEDVRARLLAHRANAACGACHNLLDPIGLGMENFDGIGHYRTAYGNGDPIDASGMLPDGTMFNGVAQLAKILSNATYSPQILGFAPKQVLTYAASRQLEAADQLYLNQYATQWAQQNYQIKALVQDVVLSDPFRQRHAGN